MAFCQPGNSPVGGCVDGVPEVVDLSLTQVNPTYSSTTTTLLSGRVSDTPFDLVLLP